MPCDSIRETPIVFTKIRERVAYVNTLAAALRRMGFGVTIDGANSLTISKGFSSTGTYRNGEFNVPERWNLDINKVKEAYAAQIVREQAARFDWLIDETTNENGEVEFAVSKQD